MDIAVVVRNSDIPVQIQCILPPSAFGNNASVTQLKSKYKSQRQTIHAALSSSKTPVKKGDNLSTDAFHDIDGSDSATDYGSGTESDESEFAVVDATQDRQFTMEFNQTIGSVLLQQHQHQNRSPAKQDFGYESDDDGRIPQSANKQLFGFTGVRSSTKKRKSPGIDLQETPSKSKHPTSTVHTDGLGGEKEDETVGGDRKVRRQSFRFAASLKPSSLSAASTPVKRHQSNESSRQQTPVKDLRRTVLSNSVVTANPVNESKPACDRRTTPRRAAAIKAQQQQQYQQQQKLDTETPLKRLGLVDASRRIAKDTPRTRNIRRKNIIANEINRLNDDASDSDSDVYLELDDESEYSSTEEESGASNDSQDSAHADSDSTDHSDGAEENREEIIPLFDPADSENEQNAGDDSAARRKLKNPHRRRGRGSTAAKQQSENYKNYFDELIESRIAKTSDNTLAQLGTMPHKQYLQLIGEWHAHKATKDGNHRQELADLMKRYRNDFNQWSFEMMSAGFNLLFYGFGSKRNLVEDFTKQQLSQYSTVMVDGCFPALNYRELLVDMVQAFSPSGKKARRSNIGGGGGDGGIKVASESNNELLPATSSIPHLTAALAKYFSRPRSKPIILVVHNIDGPALRSDRIQSSLAELAASTNVHLIATIDHIQAGLMWSAQHSTLFNFVCHDITTFSPYTIETSYEDQVDTVLSKLVQMDIHGKRNQKITVRSVLFVMRSLTALAKNIFRVLAERQLEQQQQQSATGVGDDPEEDEEDSGSGRRSNRLTGSLAAASGELGMPYAEYFAECQSMLLVTSDSAFRNQLTEFRDHFIIVSRLDGGQGTEILFIPLPPADLQTVLDEMMS